ncbi:hypothetical protein GGP77_002980 [Salinibacter ruber]|uniref:O-antigen ligase family protein n=1 Tax=Salinibacter ruber TaxID=146919 RepID=UPI0021678ECC|nr:O-antigen ligase family protein [Salinibacter ruber]MCS3668729.1 hypothetical protein [Salinibacter ruber]
MAAYLFVVVSTKEKLITKSVTNAKWTYLFLIAPILSIPWSIMPTRSAFHGALLIAFGVIFAVSHVIFIKKDIRWIYSISMYSTVIFSLIFLLILATFGSVRVSGRTGDLVGAMSNRIPAVILPFGPYLYVMWKMKKNRMYVLLSSILLIFIVFASESRAAYGIIFSYLVLIPYFTSRRLLRVVKRTAALSLIGVIAGTGLYLLLGPQFLQSVLERFSDSQLLQLELSTLTESEGDFGRAVMFLETYNIVEEDPLIGIGYNTFKEYMKSRYTFGRISHNIVLSVWGEMGIFGLITFVGMVSTAFWYAKKGQIGARSRGETEQRLFLGASRAALTILLIHAMFRPQLTNPTLWIVLAACLGVGKANCTY